MHDDESHDNEGMMRRADAAALGVLLDRRIREISEQYAARVVRRLEAGEPAHLALRVESAWAAGQIDRLQIGLSSVFAGAESWQACQ